MPEGAFLIMGMIAIIFAWGFLLGCYHGYEATKKKREDELFK